MFLPDTHTERVLAWLSSSSEFPVVSRWTIAEFSSATARQERMGQVSHEARLEAEHSLDVWLSGIDRAPVLAADFEAARDLIRSDRVRLRTPDALHLAIARRLSARLATVDARMAEAAEQIGMLASSL